MSAGETPTASAPVVGSAATSQGARTSFAPIIMAVLVMAALVAGGAAFIVTRDSSAEPVDQTSSGGAAGATPAPATIPAAAPTAPSPSPASSTTTSPTSSTTTTTTTTTTLPATTRPPDPQVAAQGELRGFIDADRGRLQSLVGNWLPQLSAKQVGEVWPGPYIGIDEPFPYQLTDIAAEHRAVDERFGALMANGSEFNFRFGGRESSRVMDGWYITLADQPFATADGALDWCRRNLIDRDNCAAKFITNDQDAGATLVLQ